LTVFWTHGVVLYCGFTTFYISDYAVFLQRAPLRIVLRATVQHELIINQP